jgi:2-keto-4-pentenoate hydratase/2-oxohepta-3-ene-1,7-dioic acid hydratase in catechol pathway
MSKGKGTAMNLQLGRRAYVPGRIFCLAANYHDHAREMGKPPPSAPVVFMKPSTCLVAPGDDIAIPRHGREFDYEGELVLLVGKEGSDVPAETAMELVVGVGLGLDLTMRDCQRELMAAGRPWEACKAFDRSAPLGPLVTTAAVDEIGSLEFTLSVNDVVRQHGRVADMVFPPAVLVAAISQVWALMPGDLVFTGTPAGIGPLHPGDRVALAAEWCPHSSWRIVA